MQYIAVILHYFTQADARPTQDPTKETNNKQMSQALIYIKFQKMRISTMDILYLI